MNTTSQRRFTWNRAHWIGMISLAVLLALLIMGSGAFILDYDGNANWMTSPDHFVWLGSMLLPWPLALGLANVILGTIRTGSLSFPLASALLGPLGFGWANLRLQPGYRYPTWPEWVELMRTNGLRLIGQTLYGVGVLLVSYAAVAFICYAIGRYGLRALFVNPEPGSLSARMLRWIRKDAVRFGCWLAVALSYGLLLTLIIVGSEAVLGAALLINFVIPPVLLIACGAYASRDAALSHPWRALLFPLVCSLVSAPILVTLIRPLDDICYVGSVCTTLGDMYFNWSQMDQVWHFVKVFAVASFLGFAVVWAARYAYHRIRKASG